MFNDQPRPVATTDEKDFTLSIEQALDRYERAGLPRTPRSVQRYCAKGHLECRLIETPFGEKYLITADSVDKHIAYIEEVSPTTGRGMPRPVAAMPPRETIADVASGPIATSPDTSRPVATNRGEEGKYVERLEGEVEFLRGQITTKDSQIKELTERSRETNYLIRGLQTMLAPLLSSPERAESKTSQSEESFPQ
jgi:hypothetical protein